MGMVGMGRHYAEHALQRAVAGYLDAALISPVWWTSIDHAGQGPKHGAQLKARGVKPGVPDVLIVAPAFAVGTSRNIFIELKAIGGRQSAEQKLVAQQLVECGCFYSTAYSVEQVEAILRAHEIPLRGSVSGVAA